MRNIKVRNKKLIAKGEINSLKIYLFKIVFIFILRKNILISAMCQEDVQNMPLVLDQSYSFDRFKAVYFAVSMKTGILNPFLRISERNFHLQQSLST